jgi:tetratricopeptide (TPR) repeat protein
LGLYHSVINFGTRGRDLVDPATRMDEFWKLGTRASSALGALGRSVEAEPTYVDLRARYSHPELHLSTGYALAMLYARVHPPELIDYQIARAYINNSKAIATMLPDPEERAFHSVFQDNGLALIEMRLGRLEEAFRLVDEGLADLDRELPEDKHRLHRSVLVHNRGKVHVGLGRPAEGLADFDHVIELDPNYPDYYFDRADAKRRLGDLKGAIADCDAAIGLSPPFFELYYNRADIKAELGDTDGAIADFAYVVELEPDQIDARVNVISLLLETGRAGEAWPYAQEGLRLDPDDTRLLHLRGQLWLDLGNEAEARRDLDRALALDPRLVAALVSRATLAHDRGDFAAAIADLTAALEVDKGNPSLLYNRGFVFEAGGKWEAAVDDYTEALSVADDDDREALLRRRARCQDKLR